MNQIRRLPGYGAPHGLEVVDPVWMRVRGGWAVMRTKSGPVKTWPIRHSQSGPILWTSGIRDVVREKGLSFRLVTP